MAVLEHYSPPFQPLSPIQRLGNAGGTSGALLWKYRSPAGEMVLRAWPEVWQPPARWQLERTHGWLEAMADLDQVPVAVPVRQRDGRTLLHQAGRFWELAPWLPGCPDLDTPPAQARVCSAFGALGRLHRRISAQSERKASPGLRLRISEIEALAGRGLDELAALLERSPADALAGPGLRWVGLARAAIPGLLPSLRDAARLEVPLQPVLRDARPEHFLFEGEMLTGVIDFGAMGIDSVATDLARLIGAWIPPGLPLRGLALEAYRQVRPLDPSEVVLVAAIESAGDLLIAGHWLRWHFLDRTRFEDPDAVGRGVLRGLARLERRLCVGWPL